MLTHYTRPSFTLGDTTFHFVDADPVSVLDRARDAAQGKDVRLGGGAATIRQFLDAGLVDTMHVAVSQVELGSGSRLWQSISRSGPLLYRLLTAAGHDDRQFAWY